MDHSVCLEVFRPSNNAGNCVVSGRAYPLRRTALFPNTGTHPKKLTWRQGDILEESVDCIDGHQQVAAETWNV